MVETLACVGFARLVFRMQKVPALSVQALATQFVEAGGAPYVGRHAEILFQQALRGDDFAQDRATAQQLHARRVLLALALGNPVQPFENAFFRALRDGRVGIIFVEQGDVVEDVFLVREHAAQAVLDDHRDFVGEGRIVGNAVRDGRGQDVAVAVLVLQAFAIQRGASRSAAEHEPACALVAGRPGQVADALETEHRVVDVERDH